MRRIRLQAGLSMVEMLVAMGIGLALTLVIGNLFLTSKQSFTSQDDNARLQENIRFSTSAMARTVRLGGFRPDPTTVSSGAAGVFPSTTPGITGTNGAGTASDTITVRFFGSGAGTSAARGTQYTAAMTANDSGADGYVTDCRGYRVDRTLVAFNQFTIAAGANGANALFCNGTEIIPNVENMQILYGEDTDAAAPSDTNFGANYYVNAASVANWDYVVSVRIALLLRSENPSATRPSAKTYALLGVTLPTTAATDRYVRKALTFTVNLRNRPIREPGAAT